MSPPPPPSPLGISNLLNDVFRDPAHTPGQRQLHSPTRPRQPPRAPPNPSRAHRLPGPLALGQPPRPDGDTVTEWLVLHKDDRAGRYPTRRLADLWREWEIAHDSCGDPEKCHYDWEVVVANDWLPPLTTEPPLPDGIADPDEMRQHRRRWEEITGHDADGDPHFPWEFPRRGLNPYERAHTLSDMAHYRPDRST